MSIPFVILMLFGCQHAATAPQSPLFESFDLNTGESCRVHFDGQPTVIKLVAIEEKKNKPWGQIDRASVRLLVNETEIELVSGMYQLPKQVETVQIDCPITGGLRGNSHIDHWGLTKDARIRVWPAGARWIRRDTFSYPVKQRWFASQTSFANEPVAPRPDGRLYYHAGLDIGGAETETEVVAATDALVVSHGTAVHAQHRSDTPVQPRYDVLYLLDQRGWYYRYSHLHKFDPAVQLGRVVKRGQRLGWIGKEGGSGGWSHLHFEIKSRQPSGKWGTQEGYAFLWQAYQQEYQPKILAVARPGKLVLAGGSVQLDGSLSWTASGKIRDYRWMLSDGTSSRGVQIERNYPQSGTFVETLQVTNSDGETDFDFVRVRVFDPAEPHKAPPRMHIAYHPTTGIVPGTEITFQGRSFYFTHGEEQWDFGDGSPFVTTKSDGNVNQLAPDGYKNVRHRYSSPGDYIVVVRRRDERGRLAEDRLHIRVQEPQ